MVCSQYTFLFRLSPFQSDADANDTVLHCYTNTRRKGPLSRLVPGPSHGSVPRRAPGSAASASTPASASASTSTSESSPTRCGSVCNQYQSTLLHLCQKLRVDWGCVSGQGCVTHEDLPDCPIYGVLKTSVQVSQCTGPFGNRNIDWLMPVCHKVSSNNGLSGKQCMKSLFTAFQIPDKNFRYRLVK